MANAICAQILFDFWIFRHLEIKSKDNS
jgi:hypothetical protein